MAGYADRYDQVYSSRWSPKKREPAVPKGCAWGRITCVPADFTLEQTANVPYGFWASFVEEVFLRIECTPRSEKLMIPFASIVLARRARFTLRERARRFGIDIDIETDFYGDIPTIFVRRGPSWQKSARFDPALADLPE